ncbi:MAG TPA: beta-galactosidase [Phnomibacter sp.]|nr:beta-galactosidase [Phnomibacter sp.]
MKNVWIAIATCFCSLQLTAQSPKVYSIDARVADIPVYSNHLKLGGKNPAGDSIGVNNYYLSMNNKPVVPVAGEFHYSRYPRQYWDESLKKMKAGGINIIATYVFWNLHEENEGKFEWTADKDLRYFIELVKQNHLHAIVRVGPFAHGEMRNGGFPDWLLGKALTPRSNDAAYLAFVERFYQQIGQQLQGLYFKDGGPVIGIQIENEYQHSAAPWGLSYPGQPYDMTAAERDLSATQEGVGVAQEPNPYAQLGNDHMKILKALAMKAGMNTPLYTATGWGNAAIIPNESIPVTAGYAYPFWTPKRDYSPFFLYKNIHQQPDYSPVRYKPQDYPAFAAELGSGIMSVYSRRPIAVHQSFDAMINRCLGSGANGLGYYMYHGGSTPKGQHGFMSDETYGLPKISYDFQAPIGEYGQVREGFHRLKLVHFFLQHFGDRLAPMTTVLPVNAAALKPDNVSDLRFVIRVKDGSGFLFVNNFQDDTTMPDQRQVQIKMESSKGLLTIPENGGFDLLSGENAIFPFHFNLNGSLLHYATAQLLMQSNDAQQPYVVFFKPKGIQGEFSFATGVQVTAISGVAIDKNKKRVLVKCTNTIGEFSVTAAGKKTRVLVIDKSLALQSYIINRGSKKWLIFSDAVVLQSDTGITMLSDGKNNFELSIYPKNSDVPKPGIGSLEKMPESASFSHYRIKLPAMEYLVVSRAISQKKTVVELPQQWPGQVNDVILTMDYTGDTGMGFVDGELVTDEFYKGIPWQVGLRKFMLASEKPKEMVFYFRPMYKNASYLVDLQPYPQSIPDFGNNKNYLKVNHILLTTQYKVNLKF